MRQTNTQIIPVKSKLEKAAATYDLQISRLLSTSVTRTYGWTVFLRNLAQDARNFCPVWKPGRARNAASYKTRACSSDNEDCLHSGSLVCKQDGIKSVVERANSFMQVRRCILRGHDYQREAVTCHVNVRIHLSQTLRRLVIMPRTTTIKAKDGEEGT